MHAPGSHRTLIVANLTASTPFLLQEVKRLAAERPTEFHLLIPNVDPTTTYDWTLESAVRLLSRAAGTRVQGSVGGQDTFESVRAALSGDQYDDVLISTLPRPRSEWLRRDVPTRVRALGLPVHVITPPDEPSALQSFADQFSAR
ncbi:MAG TPA: hypothetical protein VFN87_16455 [Solirubrobacteraceae bacterium]|nr:hypothetical protein [Solirubrobacteraceae bacterium]